MLAIHFPLAPRKPEATIRLIPLPPSYARLLEVLLLKVNKPSDWRPLCLTSRVPSNAVSKLYPGSEAKYQLKTVLGPEQSAVSACHTLG